MLTDLEYVVQGYTSYKNLIFQLLYDRFIKKCTKMFDMRSAIKLVHLLSLEIYVNVTVHKRLIIDIVGLILTKFSSKV